MKIEAPLPAGIALENKPAPLSEKRSGFVDGVANGHRGIVGENADNANALAMAVRRRNRLCS